MPSLWCGCHTKEKPHKCLMCPAAFGINYNLKSHVKSVHDGIKQTKKRNSHCTLCDYKCYSKTLLQNHIRTHSAEQPFACLIPGCGFKTKFNNSLINHVQRFHKQERPHKCPSDGCSYKAKSKANLNSHLMVHRNEKPFSCQVPGCNYTCKKKQYLADHTSRAHSDKKPFKCSTCDFRAKVHSNLIQHEISHLKVKDYKCQVPNCGFATSRKFTLKLHFDAKHKKKGLKCTEPGCNYRCGSISALKVHLTKHKLPHLKCPGDSCNFTTVLKRCLLKHISRQHEDLHSASMVGPKQFDLEVFGHADALEILNCSFPNCGFQTKLPHQYDRHIINHKEQENRKHVCTFCFSRFSHLSKLQDHLQRHVGEKPLRCTYCQYSTGSTSELKLHARKIHHIHVIPRCRKDQVKWCGTCRKSFSSYNEFVLHSMSHLQAVVVLEPLKLQII